MLPATHLETRLARALIAGEVGEDFSLCKTTNSYEVRDSFQRIKHGHSADVKEFTLTFSSYANAGSFGIDYRITAANLPVPVEGRLNVKVVKGRA